MNNSEMLRIFVLVLGCIQFKGAVFAFGVISGSINRAKPQVTKEMRVLEIPSVQRLVQGLSEGHPDAGSFIPKRDAQAGANMKPHSVQVVRAARRSKSVVYGSLVKPLEFHFNPNQFIRKFKDSSSSAREGKFKISEPNVKGSGSYKLNSEELDVSMKFRLDSRIPANTTTQGGSPGNASPSGPETPVLPPGTPIPAPSPLPAVPSSPASAPSPAPAPSPLPAPGLSPALPSLPTTAPSPVAGPASVSTAQPIIPLMCLVPCPSQGNCPCVVQAPPQSPPPAALPVPAPRPTPKAAPTERPVSQFEEAALKLYNKYRPVHNASPLTLDKDMSDQASDYAEKIADLGALVHSGYTDRPNQEESLSLVCDEDSKKAVEQAIKNWYDEVCSYTFGLDGPQSGTSHFTALVWKNSTQLGIGKAERNEDGRKCIYFVARYRPPGNMDMGNKEYIKNVEKGSFDSSYCSGVRKEGGLDGGYGFRRWQDYVADKRHPRVKIASLSNEDGRFNENTAKLYI